MILDQGESAFIIEFNDQEGKITGYTQPKRGKVFEEGEIRNAYLAQTMSDKKFEDQEREMLTKYLEDNSWNISSLFYRWNVKYAQYSVVYCCIILSHNAGNDVFI